MILFVRLRWLTDSLTSDFSDFAISVMDIYFLTLFETFLPAFSGTIFSTTFSSSDSLIKIFSSSYSLFFFNLLVPATFSFACSLVVFLVCLSLVGYSGLTTSLIADLLIFLVAFESAITIHKIYKFLMDWTSYILMSPNQKC